MVVINWGLIFFFFWVPSFFLFVVVFLSPITHNVVRGLRYDRRYPLHG